MNITFKNGEKTLSVTMEDTSFRMFLTDIINILNAETLAKDKDAAGPKPAGEKAPARQTAEVQTAVKTDISKIPDLYALLNPTYKYPKGLSKSQAADLTALSLDPAALKHSRHKTVKGGKTVSSYSLYEISFLKSMQEACIPTETIYDEYIANPYCAERSMAAVRTRLSILKHS